MVTIRESLEESTCYDFLDYCPSLATKEMPIPMQPAEETPVRSPIVQEPSAPPPAPPTTIETPQTPSVPMQNAKPVQPAEAIPAPPAPPPAITQAKEPLAPTSTGSTSGLVGFFADNTSNKERRQSFPGANPRKTADNAAGMNDNASPSAQKYSTDAGQTVIPGALHEIAVPDGPA